MTVVSYEGDNILYDLDLALLRGLPAWKQGSGSRIPLVLPAILGVQPPVDTLIEFLHFQSGIEEAVFDLSMIHFSC